MDEEFMTVLRAMSTTTRTHRCKEDPAFVAKDTKARLRVLAMKVQEGETKNKGVTPNLFTVGRNWYDLSKQHAEDSLDKNEWLWIFQNSN